MSAIEKAIRLFSGLPQDMQAMVLADNVILKFEPTKGNAPQAGTGEALKAIPN